MSRRNLRTGLKTKTAALLILALILQNAAFAFADISGAGEASENTDTEVVLQSENTSFVSFPSRFSDVLPEGFEEQYYSFELDSVTDISISVESDDSSCQYGAELLDSGFSSLGISKRRTGQRITKKGLPAGTYFLRVFPLSDDTFELYAVSIQKLRLSESEVEKTDFSEMHMVAALQGSNSPYRMNGTDPNYAFTVIGEEQPWNYQWYRRDEPLYDISGVNQGGFYPMPQSYYASWLGPVAEKDQPISEVKNFTGQYQDEYLEYLAYLQNEGIAYRGADPQIHVQNAIALPARYTAYYEDGEGIENPGWEAHIKAGIMNYGALTTGIYWSGLSCEDDKNYYYSGWDYTYADGIKVLKNMLSDNNYQNHEVVVVGWDDDYPRENFLYNIDDAKGVIMGDASGEATPSDAPGEATPSDAKRDLDIELFEKEERKSWARRATGSDAETGTDNGGSEGGISREEFQEYLLPERDGAWIIRNSWGEGSGDDGYYYVSYCDKQLFGADNTWAYTATETTGNYNKLYEVTSLPYSRENYWITDADHMMASTVFTADEEGADVLKAINFALINNNIRYEIAVNQGEDVGKGWIEDNVYISGSKLYAGYYTVRLDKAVLLEPGEPFEVILKIQGDGQEKLAIPFVTNDSHVANLPQKEGVCLLYDPAEGDGWLDIGNAYIEDNGSSNYYAYFAIKAMCNDASLKDGETERISLLDIDPEDYFPLIEKPDPEEPDTGEASPSNAGRSRGKEDQTYDEIRLQDGHVLMSRTVSEPIGASELSEPETILPESFDLRAEGVLTPIKNQATTNTCWSFGSTAAVESSYLLNGSNLYDFNYSSGISLETGLPLTKEGTVIYRFDKEDAESLDDALFIPKLLSWDEGPIEDAYGQLRWELSGDLSAVDTSDFKEETGGTELTENGEEVLLFTPKESGVVTVKVSSADDPTKIASCRVMLLEEDPVDSITVSPVSLRLRAGRTYQLSVTLEAPEGSEAKPVFSSDNPNIATVDDNGLVLGVSSGTTVIRVRAGGEEATCKVTVWKESSGGYVGSPAEDSGMPTPVNGSWTLNADGSWNFSSGGSIYKDTWGYLYNPYGNNGRGEAGWFRFDKDGRMLTGWFQDKDGSWYYLNDASDGNLGMMLTGWQKTSDGNIYYLNPDPKTGLGRMLTGWQWIGEGPGELYCYYFYSELGRLRGALAVSCITPDGYEVDDHGRWCVNGVPQTSK